MTTNQDDLLERVLIYEALSDEADEFYLGSSMDLENASPNGFYCRVRLPRPITIYEFISILPKTDVAGLLCACGYAIRESVSLFDALEEMDFGINTGDLEDVEDDQDIAALAFFCLIQLKPMEAK